MSKQIMPYELAEIVTGLLVAPDVMGSLDMADQHMAFMQAIGEVVADFCGGHANGVNPPMLDDSSADAALPSLSVSPTDSLPFDGGVWKWYDPTGWDEEDDGVLAAPDFSEIESLRQRLQALLVERALRDDESVSIRFSMQDWRINEGAELDDPADGETYEALVTFGNQCHVELNAPGREHGLTAAMEVDKGVPAIHLGAVSSDSDDLSLHVHVAQGGLVLTPDFGEFEVAEVDRFTYGEGKSLLVK